MKKSFSILLFSISVFALFFIALVSTSRRKPSLSTLRRAYDGLGDNEEGMM